MLQTCRNPWCKQSFDITQDDLLFYDQVSPVFAGKKFAVPPPPLCPDCRRQRRYLFRNERNLYRRSCDLCKKQIVSVYQQEAPFPVYCNRCWWSDQWDPFASGVHYDPASPLLEQWISLRNRTPQLAIQNDNTAGSDNCEYCYDFAFGKNCYLTNCTWHVEEAYYCESCNFSKFLVDCHMVLHECELCYECIDCEKIYGSSYLQSSDNCSACAFGFDLKGCRNCFACAGLRHKEYHIFNEPVAPDEYARRMESFAVGSFEEAERMKREFAQWILRIPRQFARIRQSEGCEGNNIFNSKHATGFDVFKCEEGKFLDWAQEIKHCYDMLATGRPQWCLDCVTPDSSFRVLFSNWCWQCSDILLSDNCHSSTNLLFCSGLKHKKYCIFNVQYTKETYERLAAQILEELATTPVWGNLFPAGSSPFAYNETVAMHHYPLTKDDVLARGWRWSESLPFTTGKETIAMADIPDAIVDSSDDILTGVLACNACARNFRILAPELALYRQMHVPIPRQCPECRYRDRLALRLRKKLWDRQCGKCGKAIRTPYASERPETVYCEECYLKEVY